MEAMIVRPAEESDLVQLADIYNHYVRTSAATFDIEPVSLANRREWFGHYHASGPHRLLVAACGNEVFGYASSSPFHVRRAYETSAETSVYVHPDHRRQGVGVALYTRLFQLLAGEDLHRIYAGMTLPNPGSYALHKKFGFNEVGIYHEVGRKFGQYWSVQWFEKELALH